MEASIKRGALERVSWNAIITGFFCSIAVQIALGLFGAALAVLGRTVGVGWGVLGVLWGLAVSIAAGFVGAYVAVRVARAASMTSAELHGALVWCLSLVAAFALLGLTMPGLAGAGRPGSAGGLAIAGLSSVLLFGGAIWGAAVGRRGIAAAEVRRGEREAREVRAGYGQAEPPRTIPPHEPYYPTQPPGERH